MDTFLAFLVAGVVVFFFMRRYLRALTSKQSSAAPATMTASAAPTGPSEPCPRCSKPVPQGSAFCQACGAAMAMWSVHRAAIKAASAGGSANGAKGIKKPVINATLCIGCGTCVEVCPEAGTLEMVGGKAILAHSERCTGHAKCAEVCPTNAILMSEDGKLQTIRVPRVNEQFETNIPGIFIVGELGGMGLIKTAINEGKLVIDQIRKRLPKPANTNLHDASGPDPVQAGEVADVIIVGSGPAGISATLSAHQHFVKYVTLEQGEIASTIRHYPRHKFLMAEPPEIPLYGPLYVSDGTKEALLSVWETIIANTGIRINTNERVDRIIRQGESFTVETKRGQYFTKFVVLAMGRRGTPRSLNIPGEDLGKVAYSLIEADTYKDKDVIVVGGGDSAIEAALALSKGKQNRVTLVYRGDVMQRARDRNQKMLTDAAKEDRVKILLKSNVLQINADSAVIDIAGQKQTVKNDFVFIMAGGNSPEEFLQKVGVEIVEKSLMFSPTSFS